MVPWDGSAQIFEENQWLDRLRPGGQTYLHGQTRTDLRIVLTYSEDCRARIS